MAVAKLLYSLAALAVDSALRESEWEKRLSGNPGGYAFGPKGYSCRLCGGAGSDGMWYDRFGLKCLHCQNAVETGIVPGELTGDADGFYTREEMGYFFNVDPRTLSRWTSKGIIKARAIADVTGDRPVHVHLFLLADNAGFLPPKQLLEFGETVTEEIGGSTICRQLKWYECCDPFRYLKNYGIMKYLRSVRSRID